MRSPWYGTPADEVVRGPSAQPARSGRLSTGSALPDADRTDVGFARREGAPGWGPAAGKGKPVDAVRTLEGEVRELIRRSGLDPLRDEPAVRRLVHDAVTDYDERSMHGGMPVLADLAATSKAVWDSVVGYGPLQQYFDDPAVEEIWVNEPARVFVARHGVAELTTTLLAHEQVRDLVERMLKSSGRRVDLSSPFVDAVLPDGSRLHVVIPDITREHWFVNIRKFVVKADSMDDLLRLGTLTTQAARFLEAAVAAGLNVLVARGVPPRGVHHGCPAQHRHVHAQRRVRLVGVQHQRAPAEDGVGGAPGAVEGAEHVPAAFSVVRGLGQPRHERVPGDRAGRPAPRLAGTGRGQDVEGGHAAHPLRRCRP